LRTQQPELVSWLAAIRLSGIGPVTLSQWLAAFGDIKTLFSATEAELNHVGFTPKQIYALQHPEWHAAEKDLHWCDKHHCAVISILDPRYPSALKEIHGAPTVLFVQGDAMLLNQPQLAIVGSRNPTAVGRDLAHQFAQQLTQAGLLITSGFALGTDAAAHRGALAAGGKTVAVFGTGLDVIYPASHRQLAEAVLAHGALVSEFSPEELPHARNFPRRNRIISGLSLGVLVVEAALRSGSLITAKYALEQGRDVFAIPGSIHNPLVRGCHELIRQGAKLVETAKDVIEELGGLKPMILPIKDEVSLPRRNELDKKTRAFLAQMSYEVTSFDTIIMRSGLTASEVSSMLLTLELLGYVRTVHGGYQLK
jgi:DNA processing protein